MGRVCHKNDVEIFVVLSGKKLCKEKNCQFPPPALVLACSRICLLFAEKREEYLYF